MVNRCITINLFHVIYSFPYSLTSVSSFSIHRGSAIKYIPSYLSELYPRILELMLFCLFPEWMKKTSGRNGFWRSISHYHSLEVSCHFHILYITYLSLTRNIINYFYSNHIKLYRKRDTYNIDREKR